MNKNTTYFTRAGLQKVQHEIYRLEQEIKKCNIKIGETVQLDNDLRENPEFMALRNRAEYELPAKIQELGLLVKEKVIIEEMEHIRESSSDFVSLGHEVTLISDSNTRVVTILGYGDSDPRRQIVSYLTPIAQLLLEKEVTDAVALPSSKGSEIYEIDSINISPLVLYTGVSS